MPCRFTAAAIYFVLSCASPVAASVTLFDTSRLYSATIGAAGLYRITVGGARGGATDGAFVQLELLKPAVIPMPASIWLLLGGLAGIAALRRRAA
jgi:hypothetical protein